MGGREPVTTTVVAVAAREDSACGARQRREVGCYLQREGANVRQARVGSLRAGRRGRARINLPCTAGWVRELISLHEDVFAP